MSQSVHEPSEKAIWRLENFTDKAKQRLEEVARFQEELARAADEAARLNAIARSPTE